MFFSFFQDLVRPFAGGDDILAEVDLVDITPEGPGRFHGFFG